MPRVTTSTRRKAVLKRPMTCRVCGKPIEVGETYYTWKKRVGGISFMHREHGFPKPSMLSGRKTAVIEDAIVDADFSSWAPEIGDHDVTQLQEILSGIADVAEEVGAEYESGADNMPESLQQGSQAEAMRDVAQRLTDWAEELRDWEPAETDPDYGDEDTDDVRQEIFDCWVEETREGAEQQLGDMPEYEG